MQELKDQGRRELGESGSDNLCQPKCKNVEAEKFVQGCLDPTALVENPTNQALVFTVDKRCTKKFSMKAGVKSEGKLCSGIETTIKYTITPIGGGSSTTCEQKFKIKDMAKPILTFSPSPLKNAIVECKSGIDGQVPTVTAQDGCDPIISWPVTPTHVDSTHTVTCAKPFFRTYTWTAKDTCGNTATAKQVITVTYTDDLPTFTKTPPPTLDVLCNINVLALTDAITLAAAAASGPCDNNVALITVADSADEPGGCLNDHTFTRTWTATNKCGFTNHVSQTIHVFADKSPILTGIPDDVSVVCDTNVKPAPIANTDVTAKDVCGNTLTVNYTPEGHRSGCSGVYTRTWKAVDDCKRVTTDTQTITVTDAAPTIDTTTVPADSPFECAGADLDAFDALVRAVTYTDDCDASITTIVDFEKADFVGIPDGCTNKFTRTYTLSATDSCGNTAAATPIVATVNDKDGPTLKTCDGGPGSSTTFDLCKDKNYPLGFTTYTTHDNCDDEVLDRQIETSPVCCTDDKIHVRKTWNIHVADKCGNQADLDCTQTITSSGDACNK